MDESTLPPLIPTHLEFDYSIEIDPQIHQLWITAMSERLPPNAFQSLEQTLKESPHLFEPLIDSPLLSGILDSNPALISTLVEPWRPYVLDALKANCESMQTFDCVQRLMVADQWEPQDVYEFLDHCVRVAVDQRKERLARWVSMTH
jgi:hypothetical protein